MSDMNKFCEAKSDQLNNVDLIGNTRIIRITKVKVTATGQQDCTIWYDGDNGKPWKPCKTTGRILMQAWGENIQNYVGKYVELYRDADVTYAGKKEGGIRIQALSDIPEDFETVIRLSRNLTKPIRVKKLIVNAETDTDLSDLKKSGSDAAKKGLEAYTAWGKSLTADQRAKVKPHLSAWLLEAKEVDAGKSEEVV